METLSNLRQEVDVLDQQLLHLLNDRARLALLIGKAKVKMNLAAHCPDHEKQVLSSVIACNEGPLLNSQLAYIFEAIISSCRALQQSSVDFSKAVVEWRNNSPRINDLADKFSSIATGSSGVPLRTPLDEDITKFFHDDIHVLEFYKVCRERFGTFGHHFISSVPYSFQEWCRLGSAMTLYLSNLSQ